MKIQNKMTWLGVCVLITIEQGIKIIINNQFLDKQFSILPPLLYFKPMFNRNYSWVNSMLQLGVSKGFHIVMGVLISIFMYLFYQYLNQQAGPNKIINILFAFAFSGAMCSLIDKIFWNGSLDYIFVNGFFTFDLKDVYLSTFVGLLLLSLLLKNKVIKRMSDMDIVKGFSQYILQKIANPNSGGSR